MHARDLVELAALVAANARTLLASPRAIVGAGLQRYWVASRCRLDRWGWTIKQFTCQHSQLPSAGGSGPRVSTIQINAVVEEVLAGEVLSRVWAGLLAAHDRRRGAEQSEPIARAVLGGHLEARQRVLSLLVRGPGISAPDALELNRLRRKCERWTDMLFGHLVVEEDVSQYAANPATAREFAADLVRTGPWTHQTAWALALVSLRSTFRNSLAAAGPNEDLNDDIARGVIGCFGPEAFGATGLMHSAWITHLTQAADDAQGLIESLFDPQSPPPDGWHVGDRSRMDLRRRFDPR